MLNLDQPAHGVILGIDPGTVTMGFCAMVVDLRTLERISVETVTINANRPVDGISARDFIPDSQSELFIRIRELSKRFWDILVHYAPFQTAIEVPFFNSMSPSAFEPLIHTFSMLVNTLYNYNPWMTAYRVDNTTTKAMVAPESKEERKRIREAYATSKERIAECVRLHTDFTWIKTETMDEHEVDACLVAEWRRRQLMIGLLDQP